jgi:hypothetical protein
MMVTMICNADPDDKITVRNGVEPTTQGAYVVTVACGFMEPTSFVWQAAEVTWLATSLASAVDDGNGTITGLQPLCANDVAVIPAEDTTFYSVGVSLYSVGVDQVTVLLTKDEARDAATKLMAMVLESSFALPSFLRPIQ